MILFFSLVALLMHKTYDFFPSLGRACIRVNHNITLASDLLSPRTIYIVITQTTFLEESWSFPVFHKLTIQITRTFCKLNNYGGDCWFYTFPSFSLIASSIFDTVWHCCVLEDQDLIFLDVFFNKSIRILFFLLRGSN